MTGKLVSLKPNPFGVMAVLVTAIHVFLPNQDVDARDKPAHDVREYAPANATLRADVRR
jgi:hypothetical protein